MARQRWRVNVSTYSVIGSNVGSLGRRPVIVIEQPTQPLPPLDSRGAVAGCVGCLKDLVLSGVSELWHFARNCAASRKLSSAFSNRSAPRRVGSLSRVMEDQLVRAPLGLCRPDKWQPESYDRRTVEKSLAEIQAEAYV